MKTDVNMSAVEVKGMAIVSKNKKDSLAMKRRPGHPRNRISKTVELVTPTSEETAEKVERNYEFPSLLDSFFRKLGEGETRVLPHSEVTALSKQIIGRNKSKARDNARVKLTEHNLRLVVLLSNDFCGRGIDQPDLIQEGVIGLMRAVDLFDYRKGFTFATYAWWWIRQAMFRAISKQASTIRVPINVPGAQRKVLDCAEKLAEKLSRPPTEAEIAKYLKVTPEVVRRLLDFRHPKMLFLDKSIDNEDGEGNRYETIADERAEDPSELANRAMVHDSLMSLIERLPSREQSVIKLRFGFEGGKPHTLEEVGQKFGVTRERIRQIQEKVLRKLRTRVLGRDRFGYS